MRKHVMFRELRVAFQHCSKREVLHPRGKWSEKCVRGRDLNLMLRWRDPLTNFRGLDLDFVKNILLPVLRLEKGQKGETEDNRKWLVDPARQKVVQTCRGAGERLIALRPSRWSRSFSAAAPNQTKFSTHYCPQLESELWKYLDRLRLSF